MPAKSKKQQRFFGMVHARQKGKDVGGPDVEKVAKEIDFDDADDFASTKHKGLPEKVKEKKDECSLWEQWKTVRENQQPLPKLHRGPGSIYSQQGQGKEKQPPIPVGGYPSAIAQWKKQWQKKPVRDAEAALANQGDAILDRFARKGR